MKKVLVVDDDPDFVQLMCEFLSNGGYASCAAGDGEEAMDVFQKEKPDIVLTDIKMPSKDGFEFIADVKNLDPAVPIIAISGAGIKDYQSRAKALKVNFTLVKPLEERDLNTVVDFCAEYYT